MLNEQLTYVHPNRFFYCQNLSSLSEKTKLDILQAAGLFNLGIPQEILMKISLCALSLHKGIFIQYQIRR